MKTERIELNGREYLTDKQLEVIIKFAVDGDNKGKCWNISSKQDVVSMANELLELRRRLEIKRNRVQAEDDIEF